MKRGKNDSVSQNAALNPNCPKEILAEVLKRGNNDIISRSAAMNPHCPPEILTEILKRENDDWVSYYASKNPNCPIEDKINWMMKVGIIEKEDHKKHIIEYEYKQDDFQDLKDLL